jgi:hypothetical protein
MAPRFAEKLTTVVAPIWSDACNSARLQCVFFEIFQYNQYVV